MLYPGLLTQAYRNAILNTIGLAGYWRLGDLTGTVARDEMGRNDGTYVGSPTLGSAGLLTNGDTNTAVTFASLKYATTPGADLEAGSWTTMAIIYPTNVTGRHGIVGSATGGVYMELNGTTLRAGCTNVGDFFATSGFTAAVNTTYHVAAVYDRPARIVVYYVNGFAYSAAGTPQVTDASWTAGALTNRISTRTGTSDPFAGVIDEVALWTRQLTAAEIANIYRIGRGF